MSYKELKQNLREEFETLFVKGESQERGKALVLWANMEIILKEFRKEFHENLLKLKSMENDPEAYKRELTNQLKVLEDNLL